MKKILVLGAGMVAYYLRPFSPSFASRSPRDWEVQYSSCGESKKFHEVDIRDLEGLRTVISEVDPDVVINAAAFSRIPDCENNPEMAYAVNHLGQGNAIKVCNEVGIKLVYLSTSSIFCGRTGNYSEENIPHPGTVYGQSKLRGERVTIEESDDWAIFRITGIFGDYPEFQDFVKKLILELEAGEAFPCWDQIISPTYGPFAADVIMKLIEKEVNGVWHIAGREQLSRQEVGEIVRQKIGRGTIEKVGTPEGLPANRTVSTVKLENELADLEFPMFGGCVESVIERVIGSER